MEKAKKVSQKLLMWQERLAKNETEWAGQRALFDSRQRLYEGDDQLKPMTKMDVDKCGGAKTTPHVRNIVAEIVESQVNSTIPQPKVTARRKEDEQLAKLIEDMIRDELNRLPMEEINDLQERIVPIQGGTFYLVEWDNEQRSHNTVGEIVISARHPKQIVPQAGVYDHIESMDYIFLKLPQTKEYIKSRYGVDLRYESELEPDVKSDDGETAAEDMVTQIVAYYKNGRGGIGKYSWVADIELEDLEDYQARRLRRCAKCGALEPIGGTKFAAVDMPSDDDTARADSIAAMVGQLADEAMGIPTVSASVQTPLPVEGKPQMQEWDEGDPCPYCGADAWEEREEAYEERYTEIVTANGTVIPGAVQKIGADGMPYLEPTRIPFYKPNRFPLILQRNTSLFGQLLGDSDVDKIKDQQNTINRLELKMVDRIIKSGTRITLPDRADIRLDPEDGEKILIGNPQDKAMIDVYQFEGDVTPIMAYMSQVYEEARQTIGITDSFQGRQDSSAQSGVAKQFAAAQSAGRLESKRVMKDAAYADLFRMIFQYKLAYADEPRPVASRNDDGSTRYQEFNRYDFLKQDEAGEWYWNDQFLFATDTSAPLANNRERMWQETIQMFQAGTFGDPTNIDTLIALWTKMELLHYPGASDTLAFMQRQKEQQMAQQQAMMQQQMQIQQMQMQEQTKQAMTAAAQNQVDKEAALREKALNAVVGGNANVQS